MDATTTPKLTAVETLEALNRYAADRNRAAAYRLTSYAEQESAYGLDPMFGDVARAGRMILVALDNR